MEKFADGMHNKAFLMTMDDRQQIVAKIPNPNAGLPHYTTASEVATMDFVRHDLAWWFLSLAHVDADAKCHEDAGSSSHRLEFDARQFRWSRVCDHGEGRGRSAAIHLVYTGYQSKSAAHSLDCETPEGLGESIVFQGWQLILRGGCGRCRLYLAIVRGQIVW